MKFTFEELVIYIKQFITIDTYIYGTYTLDDIKLLNNIE
jgi:hypothetical protein